MCFWKFFVALVLGESAWLSFPFPYYSSLLFTFRLNSHWRMKENSTLRPSTEFHRVHLIVNAHFFHHICCIPKMYYKRDGHRNNINLFSKIQLLVGQFRLRVSLTFEWVRKNRGFQRFWIERGTRVDDLYKHAGRFPPPKFERDTHTISFGLFLASLMFYKSTEHERLENYFYVSSIYCGVPVGSALS